MVRKLMERLDQIRLCVRSGMGASGNSMLRRRGGNGGNVYLEAREGFTLEKLLESNPTRRFKAESGDKPPDFEADGTDALDVVIPVPPGLSIYQSAGAEAGPSGVRIKLGDLDVPGQRLMVAKGGTGGNRQTRFLSYPGEEHYIVLDLRLSADFSLLGFPNSGKSTLMQALTGANVRACKFQFTTVGPLVSSYTQPNGRSISLLDMPGLDDIYAGYSVDKLTRKGLPQMRHIKFLKHAASCKAHLLVLDANGFTQQYYKRKRTPLVSAYLAMHLLERWSGGFMLDMPYVCVLNKTEDWAGELAAERTVDWLQCWHTEEARKESGLPDMLLPSRVPRFEDFHLISATKPIGIDALKNSLPSYLDRIKSRNQSAESTQSRIEYHAVGIGEAVPSERSVLIG